MIIDIVTTECYDVILSGITDVRICGFYKRLFYTGGDNWTSSLAELV